MVLWEITLATAYFLGLKTTYRHVLRIQRRLISPNSPRIRQFLHSKTRTVFDVTLKLHREVQKRDIEAGRNLGNWILRWLDKVKPAAQIQGASHTSSTQYTTNYTIRIPKYKLLSDSRYQITARGVWYRESRRRLINSSRNLLLTAYPTVSMLLKRRQEAVVNGIRYREMMSRVSGGEKGVVCSDGLKWLSYQ